MDAKEWLETFIFSANERGKDEQLQKIAKYLTVEMLTAARG